nr:NAD(P)-dependent oxidoreductase [Eubacterium sp.]
MNILLIGGSSSLMNQMIIKLKKEGHRIYLLTGERYARKSYEKVFEVYHFSYENDSLREIFDSVSPDVTLFMGAYDTNYMWQDSERESVRYISGLMNMLVAYSTVKKGKFIYLSSQEVYSHSYEENITEDVPPSASGMRGTTLVQAEKICLDFRENWELPVFVLRLDQLYSIPKKREEVNHICAKMCLTMLESGYTTADKKTVGSFLYESDAIQFIYQIISARKTNHWLYNIAATEPVNEVEIAEMIREAMGQEMQIIEVEKGGYYRRVLSNERFAQEFDASIYHPLESGLQKLAAYMEKHKNVFLLGEEERLPWWKRAIQKCGWLLKAAVPFIENMICFIPFFMLNNRTVGSQYFARLDFYLFYVLLFAIVYGQHQAIFSAVLAVCGYLFRQMYTRSGFEVMLDYTTYIWMAQLFILGLVVGYMRDQIRAIKSEGAEVQEHLNRQLGDIRDINNSNVRVKDVLEKQVIDQKDSIGKLYSITSTLDQYTPEEVLFYAVEILSKILRSPDVAIYTVYNDSYARMFSASSSVARKLGNSIRYPEMGEMYQCLLEQKVYINRQLDEKYPLMANAIYENDEMKMIVMVWGIPWERMTLGQANLLVVISYLIQNATLRANRYMAALEEERYLGDTKILEPEAFTSLVMAYQKAEKKNLTECTLLRIEASSGYEQVSLVLMKNLRQTDYLGTLKDGKLYVLLANTDRDEAAIVIQRFAKAGYQSKIVERIEG